MTDDVVKDDVEEIQPDPKTGKYPETVSWQQHVAAKETIGGKLTAERQKVATLEEQLKTAVKPDELAKAKQDLVDANAKLQTTTEELTQTKEKTLTEKRGTLTKRGIPEDKVSGMSVQELDAALVVLEHSKSSPDLGGGGGANKLEGSPMELATRGYASSNK